MGGERGKRDNDGGSKGRVREELDTEKDREGGKSERGRRTEGELGRTEGEQGIFREKQGKREDWGESEGRGTTTEGAREE